MKKILLLFILFLTTLALPAQIVTLTFTGKDGNNKTIKLEFVHITNLTKGWDLTLPVHDTILTMGTSGVEEFEETNTLRINQNVPNPFEGVTGFALQMPKAGNVSLEITDMNGRTVVGTTHTLPAGTHHFQISLSTAGLYLLSARCDQQIATIKLANYGQVGENAIEYLSTESRSQQLATLKGDSKGVIDKPFSVGDRMYYYASAYLTGHSYDSHPIEKQQFKSETITFHFDEIDLDLPDVYTTKVSKVTFNSLDCGGYISNNSSKAVTARGFCWGTDATPTLNGPHTLDGTGTGDFSHQLTDLEERTTYYVRAYATNSDGTAYGNTFSVNTLGGVPCAGTPTVTDRDGNTYKTIQIGEQCWMKENLRTTKYADGTPITQGNNTSASTTVAYWYYPNNNANNKSSFGLLYNWKAVMRNASSSSQNPSGVQGICPNGWHVPSYQEWFQFMGYMGAQSEFQCSAATYSIARAISSTKGWNGNSNLGHCSPGQFPEKNNSSGFSIIPAGNSAGDAYYLNFGNYAFLWSATANSSSEPYHFMIYCNSELPSLKTTDSQSYGMSVRCVRN
ncbi:MAG: T9SS type A sorting domain-containing protein [Bacteroidales bacterium]|nr:T9SS type A sorting domain-containing protein [Bacteroidales bacterium]